VGWRSSSYRGIEIDGVRTLRCGLLNQMAISDGGSGIVTGRRTSRSHTEKIAVFAAMAKAHRQHHDDREGPGAPDRANGGGEMGHDWRQHDRGGRPPAVQLWGE
jgi:hypothetical protein